MPLRHSELHGQALSPTAKQQPRPPTRVADDLNLTQVSGTKADGQRLEDGFLRGEASRQALGWISLCRGIRPFTVGENPVEEARRPRQCPAEPLHVHRVDTDPNHRSSIARLAVPTVGLVADAVGLSWSDNSRMAAHVPSSGLPSRHERDFPRTGVVARVRRQVVPAAGPANARARCPAS